MKKLMIIAVLLLAGIQLARQSESWLSQGSAAVDVARPATSRGTVASPGALSERDGNTQVTIQGIVSRVLEDDPGVRATSASL